jgi:HK97 family phage prohead protease
MTVIRKTTVAAGDGLSYVMSDDTVDRMGDVINPDGWELDHFKGTNPVALFNHNSNFPIGQWTDVRVEKNRLIGKLKLAERGTSDRINEIISLVRQGVLRAVSVGFQPIESEPLKDNSGTYYKRNDLLECSLVSVPANPSAVQLAKSLNTSDEVIDLVFGEHASRRGPVTRGVHGEHAEADTSKRKQTKMTPLSKRIEDAQTQLSATKDQLEEHITTYDESVADDKHITITEELNAKLKTQQRNLDSLLDYEKQIAASTAVVKSDDSVVVARRPFATAAAAPDKVRDGEHYMRIMIATMIARARGWRGFGLDSPEPFFRALTERFGEDGKVDPKTKAVAELTLRGEHENPLEVLNRVFNGGVQRTATTPASTGTPAWAGYLVTTGYQDFLQMLLPASVFPGLASRSMRMTFGRNGILSLPSRVSTPTIAGAFVAEGAAIPVKQGAYTAQTFLPKKMGVISAFTREIAEHSTPAITELIKLAMQEDTSVSLDAVLLDNVAATAIRPAGIRAGVAGLTPTAGGGFAALIGDIKQLTAALMTGSNGNIRTPVWLMNPSQALSIQLTQNAGGDFPFAAEINGNRFTGYPVIVSGNVPATMVILLDAADFAVIEGGAPRFDVSDQAVLHFEDTAPLQIASGAQGSGVLATPTRSLWQTDSMAIRMILDVNWGFIRTGTIAWATGVTW